MTAPADPALWRRFALSFAAAALGLTALLYGFILALDPYGTRAGPGRAPRPIMDINQRFMYPQIVRSGRLRCGGVRDIDGPALDPERLGATFGGAVRQSRHECRQRPGSRRSSRSSSCGTVPRPKALIFGLDQTWCEERCRSRRS